MRSSTAAPATAYIRGEAATETDLNFAQTVNSERIGLIRIVAVAYILRVGEAKVEEAGHSCHRPVAQLELRRTRRYGGAMPAIIISRRSTASTN